MFAINTVVVSGNLTRDPELRHTPSGTAVLDLGVAHNDREKQGDEWVDRAHYFDVTVWGKLAEFCDERLEKGSAVVVEGRLRYESWENDEGEKRSKVKIVAEKIKFPARDERSERDDDDRYEPASAPAASASWDDDIPF